MTPTQRPRSSCAIRPTGRHLEHSVESDFDLCQGNRAPSCTTSAIYGVPFSLGQPYGRPRVDSGPDVVAKWRQKGCRHIETMKMGAWYKGLRAHIQRGETRPSPQVPADKERGVGLALHAPRRSLAVDPSSERGGPHLLTQSPEAHLGVVGLPSLGPPTSRGGAVHARRARYG